MLRMIAPKINTCLLTIFMLGCMACGKPLPDLENFDRQQWVNDKNACGGARRSMRSAIDSQKEKLLALEQLQIVELLGRPDENELTSRNQKFFYYYLEPGPACKNADSLAAKLSIRFNALGLAKEVAVVRGKGGV